MVKEKVQKDKIEKEKLMQKEIEEKRKLSDASMKKIDNEIFYNLLLAIGILVYVAAINLSYWTLEMQLFRGLLKCFIIILTVAMIIFFELAYKKEKIKFAITGIELLVLNSVIMYLPYVYYYIENQIIVSLVMLVSVYFGIYYSIKCFVIYKKEDKKHKNSMSDVREIMKETKQSYLEEESKKILKEKKENVSSSRKKNLSNDKKEKEKNKNNTKTQETTKTKNESKKITTKKPKEKEKVKND